MPWSRSLILSASLVALAQAAPAAGDAAVKVLVQRDGVYRVTDAALRAAAFDVAQAGDVARLRLRLRGEPVPTRLLTGGLPPEAGRFALDFVGRHPRGRKTYEDEYNTANVYLLDLAPPGEEPARFAVDDVSLPPTAVLRRTSPLRTHYEVNRKLMRFSGTVTPDEVWFWELLMGADAKPRTVSLAAQRVRTGLPWTLRVRLFGYSSLPQERDHLCHILWNGRPVGQAAWDGQQPFVFEKQLPPGTLREGTNRLSLQVKGEKTNGIDVVLLDWVELEYAQRLDVGASGQLTFNASGSLPLTLDAGAPGTLTVFDTARGTAHLSRGRRYVRFQPGAGGAPLHEQGRFFAVRAGAELSPFEVSVSRPADLRAPKPGAAFVIVTQRDLMPAARRLAHRREQEGLRTRLVDVADAYDLFNDGFLHPDAVRDFLKFAWAHWEPRPRYVLLLGDASWDYKSRVVDDRDYPDHVFFPEAWAGTAVPKIGSTPVAPGNRNDRQRVPTYQWQSPWGHAASDTEFAVLDGDDLPDLALGRIPAGNAQEADEAVDKVLAYAAGEQALREGALFITDQYASHQRQSDRLADQAQGLGYDVTRIYPKTEEKDNEGNSAAIRAAFDAGQALVVFAGHGGRYIWRTGPPDPQKNHDLFTLEHLDQLQTASRLPVVISLTCYSAPFDHPTADSIGEKMLRLRDKGAIAVIASSWRNVPPFTLAEEMIGKLGRAAAPRLGDAFLAAMRSIGSSSSVHTYNLLGDPTLPFTPPPAPTPSPSPAAVAKAE